MKQQYEDVKVEVVLFDMEDVITTSLAEGGEDWGEL